MSNRSIFQINLKILLYFGGYVPNGWYVIWRSRVPQRKSKHEVHEGQRRTVTINRSKEVIDEVEEIARKNDFKRTADFLLVCVETFKSAVDQETSASIGQLNRKFNALLLKLNSGGVIPEELRSEELAAGLRELSVELRLLTHQFRKKS